MTLSDEQRVELAALRLANADQALADARKLLESDSLRGAVNRVYYAMFYAVSALAIARNQVLRKHSALIGWFQKEYAKTELLARTHGRALQKAFEDRSEADYEDYITIAPDSVSARIAEADALIDAIRGHLRGCEESASAKSDD